MSSTLVMTGPTSKTSLRYLNQSINWFQQVLGVSPWRRYDLAAPEVARSGVVAEIFEQIDLPGQLDVQSKPRREASCLARGLRVRSHERCHLITLRLELRDPIAERFGQPEQVRPMCGQRVVRRGPLFGIGRGLIGRGSDEGIASRHE